MLRSHDRDLRKASLSGRRALTGPCQCDKRSLNDGQIRFGNNFDRFATLYEGASKAVGQLSADAGLGLAPHSLRAVVPQDLPRLVELANGRPIHLHLAEQNEAL